jgi:hypothetical protein
VKIRRVAWGSTVTGVLSSLARRGWFVLVTGLQDGRERCQAAAIASAHDRDVAI